MKDRVDEEIVRYLWRLMPSSARKVRTWLPFGVRRRGGHRR